MTASLFVSPTRSPIIAALALALGVLGAAPAPASPSASAILDNAVRTEQAVREPSFAAYALAKEIRVDDAVMQSNRYHVWRRTSDGRARIYDDAAQSNRFGEPELGDPLRPLSMWGAPAGARAPAVTTDAYDVTLAGKENVDGHEAYHLVLRAKPGGPESRNLTDAFVDVAESRIVEVRFPGVIPVQLSGRRSGSVSVPVVYDVVDAPVGSGRWALARFTASGSAENHRLALSYRVSNLTTPASVPDWYFDASAFKSHASKDPSS